MWSVRVAFAKPIEQSEHFVASRFGRRSLQKGSEVIAAPRLSWRYPQHRSTSDVGVARAAAIGEYVTAIRLKKSVKIPEVSVRLCVNPAKKRVSDESQGHQSSDPGSIEGFYVSDSRSVHG